MRTSENHPNYCIVDISQNTEKSSRDLRLVVNQTTVGNHQLTLSGKTRKGVNNNNNDNNGKKKRN